MKITPALVLLLAACGTSGTGGSAGADVADSSGVDSAAVDFTPAEACFPDVRASDVASDAPGLPPDPAAVFERRKHPGCLSDSGTVDRVRQYRTPEVLPDLDTGSLAVLGDGVLAGTASGLFALAPGADGFRAVPLAGDPAAARVLGDASGGAVYVAQAGAVWRVGADLQVLPVLEPGGEVLAAFDCGDGFYLVADGVLSWSTGGAVVPLEGAAATGVTAACCSGAVVWVAREDGLHCRVDGQWSLPWAPGEPITALGPAGADGVLAGAGGTVAHVTPDGYGEDLAVGLDGLPTGGFRALAADGSRWAVGHHVGVTLASASPVSVEHFHSRRWLPGEEVRAVAFDPGGGLWVATPAGVAHLWTEDVALADKAAAMMAQLDALHWRNGAVSVQAHGVDPWDPAAVVLWDDDNDGQWTEEALAAFCYAYRVTGDEAWYQAGRRAVEGMFRLFDVPAGDFAAAGLGFGYPARSVVRDDEGEVFESKATQPNWHLVHHVDGHDYYWKDDTSSDEVTGHLYGLAVYHDLCAKDATEREEVAHYLSGMIGYLLDHGFRLLDLDGEPTTHGHWEPAVLAIAVDGVEECCAEHGLDACVGRCIDSYYGGGYLNAAEILGGLLAAWHVSGEARFLEAYEELIAVHRYDEVATFGENVLTWTDSHLANYCDHELADLAFLTLLRYEPHAERRALWEQQVLASFAYETGERNPLKTLVIASTQEEVPGLAAGLETLLDYPEDLRDWRVDDSHRMDAARDGEDRHGNPQFARGFPYDEIHLCRWDSNPYQVAKGGDGTERLAPIFWLLPYWGLRYHGALCP
ncbi:MAG: hypothetical protein FJ098_08100 [Deltaproteobacteria bacterium]|nr:hypothetical protein [Deltaproteobacteria bacterium]